MIKIEKTIFKTCITLLLTVLIIPVFFNYNFVNASEKNYPISQNSVNLNVKSAVAIDPTSGQIIYDKNGNKKLPIASVSKLITVYILLNKINEHKISWNSPVRISSKVAALSHNSEFTNVPLQAGKTYSVRQLYTASVVCSANAAAMGLGEYLSNNTHDFGKTMSNAVAKMGIKNYQLYNACGLINSDLGSLKNPNLSDNADNKMSAIGIAQLSQKIVNKYPQILKTTSIKNIKWGNKDYKNTDLMLGDKSQFKIDGLKTGTSDSAGENFVGTGLKNNNRLITVILGAPKGQRFNQTMQLLNAIQYDLIPNKINDDFLPFKSVAINNGKKEKSYLKLKKTKTYWLPKDESIKTNFVTKSNGKVFKEPMAPIHRGEVLGKLDIEPTSNIALLPGNKKSVPVVYKEANPVNIRKMIVGMLELLIIVILLLYFVYKFNRQKYKGKHFK